MHSLASKQICMIAYTDYLFDARVQREAETLVSAGCRVKCLTPKMEEKKRSYQLRGVEIQELNLLKYRGKSGLRYSVSYLDFLLRCMARCSQDLIWGKLDAVHVHNMPNFLILAGLLPRLAGKKTILDVHDSVPETFSSKFKRCPGLLYKLLCLEEKWSAKLADRVICVNHPQQSKLLNRGISKSKTFVSMNVPNHEVFHRVAGPASRDGRLNLIYHGTMASRLGVDQIIDAVGLIRACIPEVQLHLWGNGDDLDEFQQLSRKLGLDKQIHFRPDGYSFHELPQHLIQMDIGVLGNRKNQATELMLPVKLLEYVALGIPVVAPRLQAIQHYFDETMISFYEPEDRQSMAESIQKLYHSPELREKQAENALRFIKLYGWEKQGREFLNFYTNLLKN